MDVEPSEAEPLPFSAFERSPVSNHVHHDTIVGAPLRTRAKSAALGQRACGYGKLILLGEHAVVYGSHAIAAPIPLAVYATVRDTNIGSVEIEIPHWNVACRLGHDAAQDNDVLQHSLDLIMRRLGLAGRSIRIEVFPSVPRGMGLGSSAAYAVAVIRALDQHFKLGLDDAQVNMLAFQCEELAHGTPSGLDNTVATYGKLILYQRDRRTGEPPEIRELSIARPIPLVIGVSGRSSLTVRAVADVRNAWQREPTRYEDIFRQIDQLVLDGVHALQHNNMTQLGALMNACHAHLKTLQVSCAELDDLVRIACDHGALGAKLTGGGKGGSIIALCPNNREGVIDAIRAAGYQAMEVDFG